MTLSRSPWNQVMDWLPGAALGLGLFCLCWHALGLDLLLLLPVLPDIRILPSTWLLGLSGACSGVGVILWGLQPFNAEGRFAPQFRLSLMSDRMQLWVEFLDRAIGWIAAGAMAICGVLLFWSGGARYLAGATGVDILPDWTFEVSVFCLVWAVLLGVARIEKRGGHIRVDFLVTLFPEGARRWFEAITLLAAVCLALLFIRSGLVIVEETLVWDERTENSLLTPYWWMYAALPTSFAIHLIFIIDRFRRLLLGQLDLNASAHA